MDLLRSCTSGVHIIKSFKNIQYRVYTLDIEAATDLSTRDTLQKLQGIERAVREIAPLLHVDSASSILWIFFGSQLQDEDAAIGSSKVFNGIEDLDASSTRLELKLLHHGHAKPSDLLTADTRTDASKFKPYSASYIYSQFLTVCATALSRQLILQGLVPISGQTLALPKPVDDKLTPLARWEILDFNIQLLSIGCLRVFTRWRNVPNFTCLVDILSYTSAQRGCKNPLLARLSPCGRLALVWPVSSPLGQYSGQNSNGNIPDFSFSISERKLWRKILSSWLQSKELQVGDLANDREWTRAVVPYSSQRPEDENLDGHVDRQTLCLEWPSKLIFVENPGSTEGLHLPTSDPSAPTFSSSKSWFQFEENPGFQDPLQFALSWVEAKSQRESELQARRAHATAQVEESAVQHPTPAPFDSLSPNDTRIPPSQEAQNIYPTPSDGLPAQVTPSAISVDAQPAPPNQTEIAQTSLDGIDADDRLVPGPNSNHVQTGNFLRHSSFGEDDRYLGATTLTDIDFDFFNEPNDIKMDIDVLSQHNMRPDSNETVDEHILQNIDSMDQDMVLFEDHNLVSVALDTTEERKNDDSFDYGRVELVQSSVLSDKKPDDSVANQTTSKNISIPKSDALRPSANRDHELDDSKYSGGGKFGFTARNNTKEAGSSTTQGPAKSRPPLFFSTSIHNMTGVMRYAGNRSSSDDEQSDENGSEDLDSEAESDLTTTPMSPAQLPKAPENSSPSEVNKSSHLSSADQVFSLAVDILDQYADNQVLTSPLIPPLHLGANQEISQHEEEILGPNDLAFVSQLLAHQVVFGFVDFKSTKSIGIVSEMATEPDHRPQNMERLGQAMSNLFSAPMHVDVDLAGFLLRPALEQTTEKDHTTLLIPPSQIALQKAGMTWTFASSAASFWDTLGLEPANGHKTVLAFCVFPWSDGIEGSIDGFMNAMENSWSSHKLGSHMPGYLDEEMSRGHFPVRLAEIEENDDFDSLAMRAFFNSCQDLGTRLCNTLKSEDTAVIYIVNPFGNPSALQRLCECFVALLRAYEPDASVGGYRGLQNIVLQILPIELIASKFEAVFLDPEQSATLAHKVYGQCPSKDRLVTKTSLAIPSEASILLAKPVPKAIRFQLSINASSNVLEEGSRIHVAYYESFCGTWISAAWTDDTGEYQHSAYYRQAQDTPAYVIIQEIWETTLEIIKPVNVHWRIIVARAGVLTNGEKQIWHDLAAKQASVSHALCLVSVEISPCLTVGIKSAVKAALLDTPATMSNAYSTPGSTPHPPQVSSPAPASPSNLAAASTSTNILPPDYLGSGDIDPSIQLIDKTDESWTFILPQKLNVTNAVSELNLPLTSGYLMKRTGVGDLDPPVLIEVNLMHLQEVGKSTGARQAVDEPQNDKGRRYDRILSEILVMYRNLGLLARLRGIEGRGSCTPWHVAVAIKGAEGLRRYMGE